MKRNIYTGFPPLVWELTSIRNKNFLNDFEWSLLTNFLTKQEDQVLFVINLTIKINLRQSKNKNFKIPYHEIEKRSGLDKNSVRKILTQLKTKRILFMEKAGHWKWDLPGICAKISPEVEKLQPAQEELYSASRISSGEVLTKVKTIFLPITQSEDPLFKDLDLSKTF